MTTTKPIIPVIEKCFDCGKKVKNHHFLCDKCYSKKQKNRYWTNRIKQTKNNKQHIFKTNDN